MKIGLKKYTLIYPSYIISCLPNTFEANLSPYSQRPLFENIVGLPFFTCIITSCSNKLE